MTEPDATFERFASQHGLAPLGSVSPGPVSPLLAESTAGGRLTFAAQGTLPGGMEGTVGHLSYHRNTTFRFNVAIGTVSGSQAYVPRLFCIRKGRSTRDDEFFGFGARYSKLWTESVVLNDRYEISISPFQDENWMRQLLSPVLVDYLATVPPHDFSFELAYGTLVGSVEADDPGLDGLGGLCEATSRVAEAVQKECAE